MSAIARIDTATVVLPLPAPGETVWLQVLGAHTCFYRDEELLP